MIRRFYFLFLSKKRKNRILVKNLMLAKFKETSFISYCVQLLYAIGGSFIFIQIISKRPSRNPLSVSVCSSSRTPTANRAFRIQSLNADFSLTPQSASGFKLYSSWYLGRLALIVQIFKPVPFCHFAYHIQHTA